MLSSLYRTMIYEHHISPPECFVQLESHFNTCFFDPTDKMQNSYFQIATNLARRMSNFEFFALQIAREYATLPDAVSQKTELWVEDTIRTLLVAHFNACKSLLDAGAIALNKCYNLGLDAKKQDFKNSLYWGKLKIADPVAHERYHKLLHPLVSEVVKWRDAANHRITPLAMVGRKKLDDGTEFTDIVLWTDPEPKLYFRTELPKSPRRVPPLYYHELWKPKFLQLCYEVCTDIKRRVVPEK